MSPAVNMLFDEIVLGGLFEAKGMSSFSDVLTQEEVELIRLYLLRGGLENAKLSGP